MSDSASQSELKTLLNMEFSPLPLNLNIAYRAPRSTDSVILQASGTTDPGYDSLDVIESDHPGHLRPA